uniref:Uncharacterized protein n=1 Tax=Aegilops tauschii subsp. strangulata TaxID=200361 RepID=A0A453JS50_AEGTS
MSLMRNHRPSALESAERSPFKDLTNTPTNETANQASEKPKSGTNWYARMSDEKRAEYNQKRHMAQADKKAASAIGIDHEEVSEPHAPSLLDVLRTPLSNISNSNVQAGEKAKSGKNWYARLSDEKRAEYNQKRRMARADNKAASVLTIGHEEFSRTHASSSLDVLRTPLSNITAATSADTDHQFGDAALGRRKRSSDEEIAEHCKKLRIARLEKRAATTSVQVTPGTAHSGSSMQTDGQIDWLHTNPTYERQQMNVHEVVDMSVSEGRHRQESFLPGSNSLRSVQVTGMLMIQS